MDTRPYSLNYACTRDNRGRGHLVERDGKETRWQLFSCNGPVLVTSQVGGDVSLSPLSPSLSLSLSDYLYPSHSPSFSKKKLPPWGDLSLSHQIERPFSCACINAIILQEITPFNSMFKPLRTTQKIGNHHCNEKENKIEAMKDASV
jgi:hypothetical protein